MGKMWRFSLLETFSGCNWTKDFITIRGRRTHKPTSKIITLQIHTPLLKTPPFFCLFHIHTPSLACQPSQKLLLIGHFSVTHFVWETNSDFTLRPGPVISFECACSLTLDGNTMFVFFKHVCNIYGISAADVHSSARCGEQTGKRTLWQCLNPTLEHVQIQNSLLEVPTDAGLIVSDPASAVPVKCWNRTIKPTADMLRLLCDTIWAAVHVRRRRKRWWFNQPIWVVSAWHFQPCFDLKQHP